MTRQQCWQALLKAWNEYAQEAEHGDGGDYWEDHFVTETEFLYDFGTYLETVSTTDGTEMSKYQVHSCYPTEPVTVEGLGIFCACDDCAAFRKGWTDRQP